MIETFEFSQLLGEQLIAVIPIVGVVFLMIGGAISFRTQNPYAFGVSLMFNVISALSITAFQTGESFSDVIEKDIQSGNIVKVEKEKAVSEKFNVSSGNIILNPKEVNIENNDNLEITVVNGPLILSKDGEKWNCVQKENNWDCQTK